MISIAVVNRATDPRITCEMLQKMCDALLIQNARDFVPEWGSDTQLANIVVFEKDATLPEGAWVCTIQDTLEVQGALAYHDEENDVATLFEETADAVALQPDTAKPLTQAQKDMISVGLGHEICEALVNPFVNDFVTVPYGKFGSDGLLLTPKETVDAVEGNSYPVTTADGTVVACPNFLKRAWFDAQAENKVIAQFDKLGVLSEPFSIAAGGYITLVDAASGAYQTVWGARVTDAKKEAILRRGRIARMLSSKL